MFGVVLWSDATNRRAVVWCEDQGDLAFYSRRTNPEGVCLQKGDWIRFDLVKDQDRRRVTNPLIVEESACPYLAEDLTNMKTVKLPKRSPADSPSATGAEILCFATARAKSRRGDDTPRRSLTG